MKKKINYDNNLYKGDDDNERFILATLGKKPLFVIGVNPSKANKNDSDRTITMVKKYAEKNGNDSFIMLNLYAQRSTNPDELHAENEFDENLHRLNIKHIVETFSEYKQVTMLAAWGGTIKKRKYLLKCLKDIKESTNGLEIKWLRIGELTKSGHPRHPSRVGYTDLTIFDIHHYLLQ